MERILKLYALDYDPLYPVVCFDERPCFLIGDKVEPIPMKKGQIAKQGYAYEKNGSCSLLAAIEPLTGKRIAKVYEFRRKKEYALFMKELAIAFPKAKKIRLVQDNLNTHNESSFYENFPADEAFQLAQRFDWNYYTPKSASWLNMIEIEFSALSRQCLNRRIDSLNEHVREVFAFMKDRHERGVKINWQFTVDQARDKLNSGYVRVNGENKKYNKT